MYLENGREIYESDKYPGYYIDADTGDFCDENGNYIGGNQDDGDSPGVSHSTYLDKIIVYVSKTGRQYYPKRLKSATIAISLMEARRKGYRPSRGYQSYLEKKVRKEAKRK